MNMQLSVKELLEPLQTVIGVVEKKQTLPILSHVLIQLKDKQLKLTTTDMEIELRSTHAVNTEAEANFTVYAKDLIDIVRKLSEQTLIEFIVEAMATGGDHLTIVLAAGTTTKHITFNFDFSDFEFQEKYNFV